VNKNSVLITWNNVLISCNSALIWWNNALISCNNTLIWWNSILISCNSALISCNNVLISCNSVLIWWNNTLIPGNGAGIPGGLCRLYARPGIAAKTAVPGGPCAILRRLACHRGPPEPPDKERGTGTGVFRSNGGRIERHTCLRAWFRKEAGRRRLPVCTVEIP
jgi:hypothetical protein